MSGHTNIKFLYNCLTFHSGSEIYYYHSITWICHYQVIKIYERSSFPTSRLGHGHWLRLLLRGTSKFVTEGCTLNMLTLALCVSPAMKLVHSEWCKRNTLQTLFFGFSDKAKFRNQIQWFVMLLTKIDMLRIKWHFYENIIMWNTINAVRIRTFPELH